MIIAIGGTFNHLHEGHKSMLDRAIMLSMRYGYPIVIGVMSDDHMISKYPHVPRRLMRMWEERCMDIRNYIGRGWGDYRFVRVDDPSYVPDEPCILVVSEETVGHAVELIRGRDVMLSVVPMVKDAKGREIHTKDRIMEKVSKIMVFPREFPEDEP